MTQDEVDLIYDYLHENYRYDGGELIRLKTTRGKEIGKKIGSLNTGQRTGGLKINCNIGINGKVFSMQLQHLIYIYHHKIKVKYLRNIDRNPMNTNIENLEATTLSKTHHPYNYQKENKGYTEIFINGEKRYRPTYQLRGEGLKLDSYKTPDEAKQAYVYAKTLHYELNLTTEEICKKVHEKYPGLAIIRRIKHILCHKDKPLYSVHNMFFRAHN